MLKLLPRGLATSRILLATLATSCVAISPLAACDSTNGAGTEPRGASASQVTTATAPATALPPAVLTQRNDTARSGTYTQAGFNTSLVTSPNWGLIGVLPVYGAVYAQPLYVPGQPIASDNNKLHNVIYVATAMNQVRAFDADSLGLLWEWDFGRPDESDDQSPITYDPNGHAAPASSFMSPLLIEHDGLPAQNPPCVSPSANPGWCSNAIHGIGIQSTPVIDPAAGLMFLTYRTEVLSNGAYVPQQHLAALSLSNGTVQNDVVITQTASPITSLRQRVSLLLSQGVIYVAFGSHIEDPGPFTAYAEYQYRGQILPFDEATLTYVGPTEEGQPAPWMPVPATTIPYPTMYGAGIWQASTGIAADTDGSLYFTTGNSMLTYGDNVTNFGADPICSTTDPHACKSVGDAVVRLEPVITKNSAGHVTAVTFPAGGTAYPAGVHDFFMPYRARWQNYADFDLGADGTLLVPGTRALVMGGKEGILYVVNRDDMGGYALNRWTEQQVQEFAAPSSNGLLGSCAGSVIVSGGCPNGPGSGIISCNNVPDNMLTDTNDSFQNDHVLQKLAAGKNQTPGCSAPAPAMNSWMQWPHLHGTPVYGAFGNGQSYLYTWPEKDYLKAFARNTATSTLSFSPTPSTSTVHAPPTGTPGAMPGGMISLAIDPSGESGVLFASVPVTAADGYQYGGYAYGALYAFDPIPVNGKLNVLWSNTTNGATYEFAKFVPPTLANQRVYLATFANGVFVYGANGPSVPNGGGIAAVAQTSTQITSAEVGADGAVYLEWYSNDAAAVWHAPVRLTNAGFAPPGAGVAMGWQGSTTKPQAQLDLFVVDKTGTLTVLSDVMGQAWTAATPVSAAGVFPAGAQLATGIQGGDGLDVFCIDTNGFLEVAWHSPGAASWSGPVPISYSGGTYAPGFEPGGAIATGRQNGHVLDVFSIDKNGTLVETWLLDTFVGGWQSPGAISDEGFAPAGGGIATGVQGTNTLDVFTVSKDGQLTVSWLVGDGPPGWEHLSRCASSASACVTRIPYAAAYATGFTPGSAIATGMQDGDSLDVFIVDTSGAVTVSWLVGNGSAGWQGPGQLPGGSQAIPGAHVAAALQSSNVPNVLDVLVTGKQGTTVQYAVGSGGWSVPLGVF